MAIKAEYIWIDGTEPTARLRSKTRILADDASTDVADLPIWGFDGSSTNQAPGDNSDCVLKPVAVYADPIRGGDDVLVMCEVLLIDMTPHPTNHRRPTRRRRGLRRDRAARRQRLPARPVHQPHDQPPRRRVRRKRREPRPLLA